MLYVQMVPMPAARIWATRNASKIAWARGPRRSMMWVNSSSAWRCGYTTGIASARVLISFQATSGVRGAAARRPSVNTALASRRTWGTRMAESRRPRAAVTTARDARWPAALRSRLATRTLASSRITARRDAVQPLFVEVTPLPRDDRAEIVAAEFPRPLSEEPIERLQNDLVLLPAGLAAGAIERREKLCPGLGNVHIQLHRCHQAYLPPNHYAL